MHVFFHGKICQKSERRRVQGLQSISTSQLRQPLPTPAMAKSKNHTGHNQVYKNHRNGIKRTRPAKKNPMKGQDQKMVRNARFAQKGNLAKKQGGEAWDAYVEQRDARREG